MFKRMFVSKIILYLLVYFVVTPALPALAKRELRGKVYILGEHDELTPVTNTTVRLEATDDSDVTTASGTFRIFLPDVFKAGEKVTLVVEKEGYQILSPLGGEAWIPAELEKDLVEIRLDAVGSYRFMSREAFALLIEKIANEAKAQIKPKDEPQSKPDFTRYLKDWAVKYGLGLDEVRAELDKWAAEVEASQEDLYELGLAAFYKKNFGEAAQKFTQSAESHAAQLTKLREQEKELKAKVIRDYQMAGDAYYNDYRFQDALTAYQKALAEVDKAADPQAWASLMHDLSKTYSNLGIRVEGAEAQQYLAQAVAGYQEILTVYTHNAFPQDWAGTQNNLGNAFQEQGRRTAGEAGAALLVQAVNAYRQALTVYTPVTLPQDWATTQNNLGNALQEQGRRIAEETGTVLLAQAVTAYQQALTVRTRDTLPQDWATTQNNLGNALAEQGLRTSGETGAALLAQAVDAYRQALTVRTRDALPQDWAITQNNLGTALFEQGRRTSGETGAALLAQTVDAFQQALTVRTREALPQDWAITQNNLGAALFEQGRRTAGEAGAALLTQAVEAYKSALEILTYKHFAYYWAQTQSNLAKAYVALKDWSHAFECHFNILVAKSQFIEAEQMLSDRFSQLPQNDELAIPLHAVEIVVLIGQQKPEAVPAAFDALLAALRQQPDTYTCDWTFAGLQEVITASDAWQAEREWLRSFFAALAGKNRDAMLQGLQAVRKKQE